MKFLLRGLSYSAAALAEAADSGGVPKIKSEEIKKKRGRSIHIAIAANPFSAGSIFGALVRPAVGLNNTGGAMDRGRRRAAND